MKALALLPAALLLGFAGGLVAHSPAAAQAADDPEKIMDDCSDSDLPPEVVDYCLRRVHKLNETNPSSDSVALEAQLQRRADEMDRSGENYDRSNDNDRTSDQGRNNNQGTDNNDQSDDRNRPNADDDHPPVDDADPHDDSRNDSDSNSGNDSNDEPPQRPNSY
ncbi:MAG: hypothetical protein HY243_03990 [Proteobacteria bacterium]|nr:hypothetical protein [Pseudomonadota bacterium]